MEDLLKQHVSDPVSCDCFTVPTAIHKALCVLLILAHERRRVVPCRVPEPPTAEWTARELVEAFPCDEATPDLLRDRNTIDGTHCRPRVRIMGIEDVLMAPRSPWQNPEVERLIGNIRRECLDHVIVLHEQHLI
jgi:putative transposase